jgi:hypothetical protein
MNWQEFKTPWVERSAKFNHLIWGQTPIDLPLVGFLLRDWLGQNNRLLWSHQPMAATLIATAVWMFLI